VNIRTSLAVLVTAAATVALSAAPALARADAPPSTGCVTDTEYARLGLGQSLSYIHSVVGADALVTSRDWSTGANAYKERVYAMCTPVDSAHGALTTRFMLYDGSWRAFIVDTLLGPEPN
jgi:hypothetical protein